MLRYLWQLYKAAAPAAYSAGESAALPQLRFHYPSPAGPCHTLILSWKHRVSPTQGLQVPLTPTLAHQKVWGWREAETTKCPSWPRQGRRHERHTKGTVHEVQFALAKVTKVQH